MAIDEKDLADSGLNGSITHDHTSKQGLIHSPIVVEDDYTGETSQKASHISPTSSTSTSKPLALSAQEKPPIELPAWQCKRQKYCHKSNHGVTTPMPYK